MVTSSMSYLHKVISSEPSRVNSLLIETITLLCRNGLSFTKQLKIQGVIGITIDDSEIALIHINEFLYPNLTASDSPSHSAKGKTVPTSNFVGNETTNDNMGEPETTFSMDGSPIEDSGLKTSGSNKEYIVESPSFLFNSESPSDDEEKQIESTRRENQRLSSTSHSDSKQNRDLPDESKAGQSLDLPQLLDNVEKAGDIDKLPLEVDQIKCETIDITDEEECDNIGDFDSNNRVDRRLLGLEGIFAGGGSMNDQMFHRGLSNQRMFANRETNWNDGFNVKPVIPSDEFLVPMNIDEHNLVSEHLSNARLREDVGWQGPSRYGQTVADSDFDPNYQFIPRKRMVGTVDNRPYACPVEGCDRRFFHRNNVYRHRKQKHPLEVIFKT